MPGKRSTKRLVSIGREQLFLNFQYTVTTVLLTIPRQLGPLCYRKPFLVMTSKPQSYSQDSGGSYGAGLSWVGGGMHLNPHEVVLDAVFVVRD